MLALSRIREGHQRLDAEGPIPRVSSIAEQARFLNAESVEAVGGVGGIDKRYRKTHPFILTQFLTGNLPHFAHSAFSIEFLCMTVVFLD